MHTMLQMVGCAMQKSNASELEKHTHTITLCEEVLYIYIHSHGACVLADVSIGHRANACVVQL